MKTIKAQRSREAAAGTGAGTRTTHGSRSVGYMVAGDWVRSRPYRLRCNRLISGHYWF